jgi:hypothetical protein
MLVMTCLHGYKINDDKVLSFHEINREAFVRRLAHAFAQQFLVTGLVNGKFYVLQSVSRIDDSIFVCFYIIAHPTKEISEYAWAMILLQKK